MDWWHKHRTFQWFESCPKLATMAPFLKLWTCDIQALHFCGQRKSSTFEFKVWCVNFLTITMRKTVPANDSVLTESEEVFEKAAEVFRVMSAPMRLRILSALCKGEKNVGQLLAEIDTTQPNMSQHLNTLFQSGVVGKRREGVQIFYRITNDQIIQMCRTLCLQISIGAAGVP